MRRTATLTLALAACLGLTACNTILGRNVQTEMLIANHSDQTITLAVEQSAENSAAPYTHEQTVAPNGTVRFTGKEGDAVLLTTPNHPPMTLVFAKRSQTVTISGAGPDTSVDIHRGYTDPER